jgi:hypothetical protein
MSVMTHKNYSAHVEYDDDDGIFRGRIAGRKLRALWLLVRERRRGRPKRHLRMTSGRRAGNRPEADIGQRPRGARRRPLFRQTDLAQSSQERFRQCFVKKPRKEA